MENKLKEIRNRKYKALLLSKVTGDDAKHIDEYINAVLEMDISFDICRRHLNKKIAKFIVERKSGKSAKDVFSFPILITEEIPLAQSVHKYDEQSVQKSGKQLVQKSDKQSLQKSDKQSVNKRKDEPYLNVITFHNNKITGCKMSEEMQKKFIRVFRNMGRAGRVSVRTQVDGKPVFFVRVAHGKSIICYALFAENDRDLVDNLGKISYFFNKISNDFISSNLKISKMKKSKKISLPLILEVAKRYEEDSKKIKKQREFERYGIIED